jgi:hypothetical protein
MDIANYIKSWLACILGVPICDRHSGSLGGHYRNVLARILAIRILCRGSPGTGAVHPLTLGLHLQFMDVMWCSVCDPAKMFLTSKFSHLVFPTLTVI